MSAASVTSGHFRMSRNESWMSHNGTTKKKKVKTPTDPTYTHYNHFYYATSESRTYIYSNMCRIDLGDIALPAEHTLLFSSSSYNFYSCLLTAVGCRDIIANVIIRLYGIINTSTCLCVRTSNFNVTCSVNMVLRRGWKRILVPHFWVPTDWSTDCCHLLGY